MDRTRGNGYKLEKHRFRTDIGRHWFTNRVFKWVKGINKGNIDQVIEISSQDRTCGNRYKLEILGFRTDIGRHWFTNRVVANDWNRLRRHRVSAELKDHFL